MKKIVFLLAITFSFQISQAQVPTFKEWFQQKKTQIKYLLNQIGALIVYAEYLEKGYKIAKNGTDAINKIKHGDFDLHDDHFNSLKTVRPEIGNNSKVAGLFKIENSIQHILSAIENYIRDNKQLSASEISYIKTVLKHLTEECEKDVEKLYLVITSDKLSLTEDERLALIDALYKSMRSKLSFSKSFSAEIIQLTQQRLLEQSEIEKQRRYSGIK